jgi:hypothetical protein
VTDLQLQTTLARWNSLVTKAVLLVSVDHEHTATPHATNLAALVLLHVETGL